MRGEEPDGVVTPVVRQALVDQEAVADELVHGHELDRADAEPGQVVDDGRMAEARVGAALMLGDIRVQPGEAGHVCLVDHALVIRRARCPVVPPVEVRAGHDTARHERSGIGAVRPSGALELVAEHGLAEGDRSLDGLGVGVEQQLGRVAAMPGSRIVGAVHPVAVSLAGRHSVQVAMPDKAVDFAQRHALFRAISIEQAEFDPLGDFGIDREVCTDSVVSGAERIANTWPCLIVLRKQFPASPGHPATNLTAAAGSAGDASCHLPVTAPIIRADRQAARPRPRSAAWRRARWLRPGGR